VNRGARVGLLLLAVGLAAVALDATDAAAARRKRRAARIPHGPSYAAALVVEAETGQTLFEKNADAPRTPASLAKLMLELLTLEAIERGEVSLRDLVRVPPDVRAVRGSRVRLRPGEAVTVLDLLSATTIASANDAATALAVHVAGSTAACVEKMNRRARELGMLRTHYTNVHGLDRRGEPGNVTTARDLSILARELVKRPAALTLSSTVQTTIRASQAIHTTNRLLSTYPGVDGLKTGYTGPAGYCLVATAQKSGLRLISIVLGSRTSRRRFNESADLLRKSFLEWQKVRVVHKGQDLGEDLAVRQGEEDSVRLVADQDIDVLIPAKHAGNVRVAVATPVSTRAPVAEGWTLGRVQVLVGDSVAAECRALAAGTVPRLRDLDWLLNRLRP
jgi:D-alanyl-D-alanine carboxypeptidase (penicillin-binding protein 5/6)